MGLNNDLKTLHQGLSFAADQRRKEEAAYMKGLGTPDTTCVDEEVVLGFWARFGGVLVCEHGKSGWKYSSLRSYAAEFINALMEAKEKGDARNHRKEST